MKTLGIILKKIGIFLVSLAVHPKRFYMKYHLHCLVQNALLIILASLHYLFASFHACGYEHIEYNTAIKLYSLLYDYKQEPKIQKKK